IGMRFSSTKTPEPIPGFQALSHYGQPQDEDTFDCFRRDVLKRLSYRQIFLDDQQELNHNQAMEYFFRFEQPETAFSLQPFPARLFFLDHIADRDHNGKISLDELASLDFAMDQAG